MNESEEIKEKDMAESPLPTLSTVIEYIQVALKYIASGFIAVGTYMYLYPHQKISIPENSWFLILLASAIGTVTYAIHFATLDKFFNKLSLEYFLKKNKDFIPKILKTNIKKWESKKGNDLKKSEIKLENFKHTKSKITFALANQNYLRLMCNKKEVLILQHNFERRIALLNFLYCSFYQVAFLTIYFIVIEWADWQFSKTTKLGDFDSVECSKLVVLIVFAVILLYSAIEFNKRICSREMWIVSNFPQEIPTQKII